MLSSQQMKSYDSIKIETVGVQLPTNQLKEEVCQLTLHSQIRLGGVSLNQHHSSPFDTSSIAITHCNIQRTSILEQLPTQLPTPNTKASTFPNIFGRVNSLLNPLQRSTFEPLLPNMFGRIDSQLPLLNRFCSYF